MNSSNGYFVISLDFELHWGVFDKRSVEEYQENLKNVSKVIPRLLELGDKYDIKYTFATVGMLFSSSKKELLLNNPDILPSYKNKKFSPYEQFSKIGIDEKEDIYHYASSLIDLIASHGNHEIGTHTYSHYYCFEEGQTIEQFEADIEVAVNVASKKNIPITSIVFPRNQVKKEYLEICMKHGITCFRGVESQPIYNTLNRKFHSSYMASGLRLFDSYFNVTGKHVYSINELNTYNGCRNIPSSRFLRPYANSLKFIDGLRVARVTNSMEHAAKNNKLYHLWFHPHNFGKHLEENFNAFESILKKYKQLQQNYNFKSITMSELANQLC